MRSFIQDVRKIFQKKKKLLAPDTHAYVSFSENFAYVLNEWLPPIINKKREYVPIFRQPTGKWSVIGFLMTWNSNELIMYMFLA